MFQCLSSIILLLHEKNFIKNLVLLLVTDENILYVLYNRKLFMHGTVNQIGTSLKNNDKSIRKWCDTILLSLSM